MNNLWKVVRDLKGELPPHEQRIWFFLFIVAVVIIFSILLSACSPPTPEQIAAQREKEASQQRFVLQHTCIRKHGSPVIKDDGTVGCNYPFSIHVNK